LVTLAFVEAGVTGGVDEPSRDGIDIDESDEVEETGDGTAITLVVIVGALLAVVAAAHVVGASKFEIVGECFLLLLPLAPVDEVVVVEGEQADGDDVLGDESAVDVVVHVAGILLLLLLLLLLFTAAGALPFGMLAVVLACWPLFCPT
jgi:uncharacterized integral membrane protein